MSIIEEEEGVHNEYSFTGATNTARASQLRPGENSYSLETGKNSRTALTNKIQ